MNPVASGTGRPFPPLCGPCPGVTVSTGSARELPAPQGSGRARDPLWLGRWEPWARVVGKKGPAQGHPPPGGAHPRAWEASPQENRTRVWVWARQSTGRAGARAQAAEPDAGHCGAGTGPPRAVRGWGQPTRPPVPADASSGPDSHERGQKERDPGRLCVLAGRCCSRCSVCRDDRGASVPPGSLVLRACPGGQPGGPAGRLGSGRGSRPLPGSCSRRCCH